MFSLEITEWFLTVLSVYSKAWFLERWLSLTQDYAKFQARFSLATRDCTILLSLYKDNTKCYPKQCIGM